MEPLKTWAVEVVWRKMGPSLIRGALAAVVGLVAAHHGLLASMGISYDDHANTIDIDLGTVGAYLMVLGTGVITSLLTLVQHHSVAAATGEPQSGDLRKESLAIIGGARKDDPK